MVVDISKTMEIKDSGYHWPKHGSWLTHNRQKSDTECHEPMQSAWIVVIGPTIDSSTGDPVQTAAVVQRFLQSRVQTRVSRPGQFRTEDCLSGKHDVSNVHRGSAMQSPCKLTEQLGALNIEEKPFKATQWVTNPTRQRLATSRRRVLRSRGVTPA